MRLALGQMNQVCTSRMRFIKQLGVDHVIFNTPQLPGEECWQFEDLLSLKCSCEQFGLRLEAIENVPIAFYDQVMLGLPGRDRQIENYQQIIRNMGRAEIPILGYHWMPNGVWRTSTNTPGRAGSLVTSFQMSSAKDAALTHGREYAAEELWENYSYFLRAVLPVAEEAHVKLALHPDDPPVAALGGVPRLFSNLAAFEKAMSIVPSNAHGLDFCQGCWSEMGTDVIATIEHFGSQGKILYVHFRNVLGVIPDFRESFIDEGDTDMFAAMRAYKRVGFQGLMIPDHVPQMEGDSNWGERARAHAIGYMAALIDVVNALD